jgi:hypothetical protein
MWAAWRYVSFKKGKQTNRRSRGVSRTPAGGFSTYSTLHRAAFRKRVHACGAQAIGRSITLRIF